MRWTHLLAAALLAGPAAAGCVVPARPDDPPAARVWKAGVRGVYAVGSAGMTEVAGAMARAQDAARAAEAARWAEYRQALDAQVGRLTLAGAEAFWGPPSAVSGLAPVAAVWREPDPAAALPSPLGGRVTAREFGGPFELELLFDPDTGRLVQAELRPPS